MNLYLYRGYVYGDHVAGIVRADGLDEAKLWLSCCYTDFDDWSSHEIEKVEFDEDNVLEVYFGS